MCHTAMNLYDLMQYTVELVIIVIGILTNNVYVRVYSAMQGTWQYLIPVLKDNITEYIHMHVNPQVTKLRIICN